ncbi:Glycosyltransferase involved in cell wall bisynthesis [Desulforamulus putei DSM 12395]|uniref:Glycosyltransferase involved in cell wall bisynthesis n=1 Tax=Desulforamulus putei DSM 12395 TaxID=1121429 RepID=A0A1M4VIX3_9FIRM|nr:glycosyltransferase family 2 protein [Desulforamulus putei]SHE68908.1 Glycosyltransferase involved in cell wall bisynthesis [Desulforamulus putei DSM 12395]
MKLIVQIPCFNEEKTLPFTIRDIPRKIPGIDKVEILIIDDGSTDRTIEVAKKLGVDHIISNGINKGLAKTFSIGIDACLKLGADIIVNTDGDNQYNGRDIPKLITPILEGKADVVIGDRQTDTIKHFSFLKKKLQKLGSFIVRKASRTNVRDAASGFRAFSREAALHLNVISDFSYTMETLIALGRKKLNIIDVPINTNERLRESRLFKGMLSYINRSGGTIVRTYCMYRGLKTFLILGGISIILGICTGLRFLYFYFSGSGNGHIQSLILAAILIILGFQTVIFGILADAINANRKINDDILYRIKKLEYTYIEDPEFVRIKNTKVV